VLSGQLAPPRRQLAIKLDCSFKRRDGLDCSIAASIGEAQFELQKCRGGLAARERFY
jgi:hypothetical protein